MNLYRVTTVGLTDELVEASQMVVVDGALIFQADKATVVAAYGPGSWLKVAKVPAAK